MARMVRQLAAALPSFALMLAPSRAHACDGECVASGGALLPIFTGAAALYFIARIVAGLRRRAAERELERIRRHG